MSEPPVASPCTKVCTMEPASGLCMGCLRTLEEIAGWGGMTNEERRRVLDHVEARRREPGG